MFKTKSKPSSSVTVSFIGGKGTDKSAYKDDLKEEDEPEESTKEIAEKAALVDLATAFGVDPNKIDAVKASRALAAWHEACYGAPPPPDDEVEHDAEADKDEE